MTASRAYPSARLRESLPTRSEPSQLWPVDQSGRRISGEYVEKLVDGDRELLSENRLGPWTERNFVRMFHVKPPET